MYSLLETLGFRCFNAYKTVTLHTLRGLNRPSTAMGDWSSASFFFSPSRSGVSVSVSGGCIIAMGTQKGFIDGGQGRWLETDPESDGSEWTVGKRLRSRI